jgi:hypothetical protein
MCAQGALILARSTWDSLWSAQGAPLLRSAYALRVLEVRALQGLTGLMGCECGVVWFLYRGGVVYELAQSTTNRGNRRMRVLRKQAHAC